jgi:hypothetical protein
VTTTSNATSSHESITLQLNVTTQEGAAIFKLLAEMRTPPSDTPELHPESAAHFDPSQAKADYSDAVRQLHRQLVSAASNGLPGQLDMVRYWAECRGQAPLKELVKHCGAKDFHAFAGFSGSITKKLTRLLGSTTTVARGRPTLPEAWHGYVADLPKEEGTYTYYLAEELIQPLRQAFGLE